MAGRLVAQAFHSPHLLISSVVRPQDAEWRLVSASGGGSHPPPRGRRARGPGVRLLSRLRYLDAEVQGPAYHGRFEGRLHFREGDVRHAPANLM